MGHHFAGTTRPTDVFARIVNGDRQVIAAAVLPGLRAGRALRHVIPAYLSNLADVIENPKFVGRAVNERWIVRVAFPFELRWHGLAGYEAPELFLAQLSQAVQVRRLFFHVVVCPVKPEPPVRTTVNSKRPSDRVPELSFAQFVMLREDFDAFG